MIDFAYLSKGLTGLAHAHRASEMAGHLGAAVIAGYFFGEGQPDLDDAVYAGVENELKRIMRGEEAIWYNQKKAGLSVEELFRPLPEGKPQPESIDTIAEALSGNIGSTRQSGHNVIFAAIAIRALRDHPQYATPAVVEGIRKLIKGFDGATAGRGYYGKEQGWKQGEQVKLEEDAGFPPYKDLQAMADTTIDELIATSKIHRQGFGGLWHIINHAAGLLELSRFGYEKLAAQGLPAHHRHIRLWRSLPDMEQELGPVKLAPHDPRDPAYWKDNLKRDEARLTHRIKTLYGFHVVVRTIQNPAKRKQAEASFLYLMA